MPCGREWPREKFESVGFCLRGGELLGSHWQGLFAPVPSWQLLRVEFGAIDSKSYAGLDPTSDKSFDRSTEQITAESAGPASPRAMRIPQALPPTAAHLQSLRRQRNRRSYAWCVRRN
jgi:hypothetical protein